jgi:hypothetical protein
LKILNLNIKYILNLMADTAHKTEEEKREYFDSEEELI